MLVPDWVRTNSYRLLQLSADANPRDIQAAAAGLRRAIALGVSDTSDGASPSLGDVPRSEGDIRSAGGRLENPAHRLQDRLFWFHFKPGAEEPTSKSWVSGSVRGPLDEPFREHDRALSELFAAVAAGSDASAVALWADALRHWHAVISEDQYWDQIRAVEAQGHFEPAALPSELEALRKSAVQTAAEPLLRHARSALVDEDQATLRPILRCLEQLNNTGSWARECQVEIVSPIVDRLKTICGAITKELTDKIVQKSDNASLNRPPCDFANRRYRAEAEPTLNSLLSLVPPTSDPALKSRESASLCLYGIAIQFTWADDYICSEKLHTEALELAKGTLAALRIDQGLENVKDSARVQRLRGAPIKAAPGLGTVNGVGLTIYGNTDFDAETQSYITTHYFVILGIPIIPLGRYRVRDLGGRKYSFMGKFPLRPADRWHMGIAAGAILAVILYAGISAQRNANSDYSQGATAAADADAAAAEASAAANTAAADASTAANAAAVASGSAGESSPQAPLPTPTGPSASLSDMSRDDLKARIDAGRARIAQLESELKPKIDEMEDLDQKMGSLKSELDSSKSQTSLGTDQDVSSYNAKVDEYNALVGQKRSIADEIKPQYDEYHNLLDQDKIMVSQYNASG